MSRHCATVIVRIINGLMAWKDVKFRQHAQCTPKNQVKAVRELFLAGTNTLLDRNRILAFISKNTYSRFTTESESEDELHENYSIGPNSGWDGDYSDKETGID
ncbi:hypothetical protein FBU30_001350 [Linnemannia zychae]|nr:hypothetical protein FBU30_001350 [Linnemannia zychae]